MSNNDIRNIYESMQKGVKYVQPKRMTDLYSDVYSDLVEEATVTIDYGNGNVQTLQNVPNEKAKQLLTLKDIDDNTELLRQWVEAGGWSNVAQKILVFRLSDIYRRNLDFNNAGVRDMFFDEVRKFIQIKTTTRGLKNFSQLINANSNSFNTCVEELNRMYGFKLITNAAAISEIAHITFEEGSVGVGPGEAVFTLFTEAVNPKKGDLEVDGKEVELKGGKGRPGKTKTYNAISSFQKKISDDQIGASGFDDKLIQHCFNKLLNHQYINPDGSQLTEQVQGYVTQLHTFINTKSLDLSQKLGKVIGRLMLAAMRGLIAGITTNDGQPVLDVLLTQKEAEKQFSGKEAVQNNTWFANADDATFVKDIVMMVADPASRKSMGQVIGSILPNYQGDRLLIGSAIQVASYYWEQTVGGKGGKKKASFEYYVLFNKESFDVLTIGPFSGKSFEAVFEMSLDALLRAGEQISISPSTGGRGGWNITLGPSTNDGDE